jgi:hypothetical protein
MDRTIRKIDEKISFIDHKLLPKLRNMHKFNRLVYVDSSNGRIHKRNRPDQCRGDAGLFHYAKMIIENCKREKIYLLNCLSRYNRLKEKINELEEESSEEVRKYRQTLIVKVKALKRGVRKMSIYQV